MKRNLLFVMALGVAGLSQAQVKIDWSVDEILQPTSLQTAANGTTPISVKFVMKNNGADTARVGDTALYQMVGRVGTQVLFAIPNGSLFFRVLTKDMAPGDTLHQNYSGTLNSGATRSFDLNFSVLSYIVNRSRGLALETTADGTLANNTKVNAIVWKMIGGFGVSVQDINSGTVKVYPTMFANTVTVEQLLVATDKNTKISVYDLQGKVVMTKVMTSSTEQMNMSSLASGTYIMNIDNGTSVTSTKVIKN
jgi:hypothetical protein